LFKRLQGRDWHTRRIVPVNDHVVTLGYTSGASESICVELQSIMNRQAIVKAEEKLVRMRRAVCAMKEASEPDQIKRSWEDFIVAATTFYNALAHGAKGNNKSNAWFGKKKHARKTDPLLKYIHHARNAENHGIEQITDLASSQITLKGKGTTVTLIDAAPGKWAVANVSGDVEFANDRVCLVPVYDSDVWYDPPTRHLGQELENKQPVGVAQSALAYFEQMFAEVRELVR
jgi:hypothetical protein